MTINPRPDQEIKIEAALQAGLVTSAEEVIAIGLRHLPEHHSEHVHPQTDSLVEFFRRSPLYGLELDLDLERDKDGGRDVAL